ncbi:hypothetical protein CU097_009605 [Rhizopus azygosporus]|uniref:C2H2-type domain-containing protein n=1 Tax=Rhizopus azygosporus TaxID=86630 RepID=A0A367JAN6_RHIAZ|nr:hypothetical protein CU097_009605 [Rhizopus azygosporus]
MQYNEKPKLPPIQSMLEGVSLHEVNRPKGHRRHASEHSSAFKPFVDRKSYHHHIETSMSGQLEKLSIQPIPIEPKIDEPPTGQLLHPLPFSLSSYRSPRNLHSRSYSDYTHPYYPQSSPASSHAYQHHRRAISTNTFDLLLQPLAQRPIDHHTPAPSLIYPSSSSSSTVTTNAPTSPQMSDDDEDEDEEDEEEDEEDDASSEGSTYSETVKRNNKKGDAIKVTTSPSPPISTATTTTTTRKRRAPPSKKYHCTYCSKGFSRPSSLRIHTYSHTGERPFECPEEGCNRKFSVQSNMRRHLRVHRGGRPARRNGSILTPAEKAQLINKPLAAKPVTWNNCIIDSSISSSKAYLN